MRSSKRAFILGAGFSQPCGMPLATELLPLMSRRIGNREMRGWLNHIRERLAWLDDARPGKFSLNVEAVFHYAHFDVEVHRLRQHMARVGRQDGPGTPWNDAVTIETWLSQLEYALVDVIVSKEEKAKLQPAMRWAKAIRPGDVVLSFNYDTIVERALSEECQDWCHATKEAGTERGIPIHKLHGSIDWLSAHRSSVNDYSKLDMLFDKENVNRSNVNTDSTEDDFRLYRFRTPSQMKRFVRERDIQLVAENGAPSRVGIAGLGAYKQLHQIPGLGMVWTNAMTRLYKADKAIICGFSMSDFDTMAQMQFVEVVRKREKKQPLKVVVIDPFLSAASKRRFRQIFKRVKFASVLHQTFDWTSV